MSILENGLAGLSREEKVALLTRLERQRSRAGRTFPLSFAQQRMWFLDRLDPGNPANNIFRALTFSGDLDVAALARTLAEIVRRHEALRTTFQTVGDEPRQRVEGAAALPLPTVDLSALPAVARRPAAGDLAGSESRHAFDLARGPLFRATLVRLDEREHALFLSLHHIVADGWSVGLLFAELIALYPAFSLGHPSPLPEPELQYPDFATWQRERMTGERLRAELDWWREEIGEAATVLELPADHRRPAAESFRGSLERLALPAEVASGLKTLGREAGATLFMTLLAAFEVLLYRYTGQPDFLVGTTVAGRTHRETEGSIGFFANTLLLPVRPRREPHLQAAPRPRPPVDPGRLRAPGAALRAPGRGAAPGARPLPQSPLPGPLRPPEPAAAGGLPPRPHPGGAGCRARPVEARPHARPGRYPRRDRRLLRIQHRSVRGGQHRPDDGTSPDPRGGHRRPSGSSPGRAAAPRPGRAPAHPLRLESLGLRAGADSPRPDRRPSPAYPRGSGGPLWR